MKKYALIVLSLVLVLSFGLVGCSSEEPVASATAGASASANATKAPTPTPATPTPATPTPAATTPAADAPKPDYSNDFSAAITGVTNYEGTWAIENGEYTITGDTNGGAKSVIDGSDYANFTLEADVAPTGEGNDAGFIFRASDCGNGADSYNGYYVGVFPGGYIVGKVVDKAWTEIERGEADVEDDVMVHIKIVANGENIKLYVGDMSEPVFDADEDDHASGAIGFRVYKLDARYDNVKITKG